MKWLVTSLGRGSSFVGDVTGKKQNAALLSVYYVSNISFRTTTRHFLHTTRRRCCFSPTTSSIIIISYSSVAFFPKRTVGWWKQANASFFSSALSVTYIRIHKRRENSVLTNFYLEKQTVCSSYFCSPFVVSSTCGIPFWWFLFFFAFGRCVDLATTPKKKNLTSKIIHGGRTTRTTSFTSRTRTEATNEQPSKAHTFPFVSDLVACCNYSDAKNDDFINESDESYHHGFVRICKYAKRQPSSPKDNIVVVIWKCRFLFTH